MVFESICGGTCFWGPTLGLITTFTSFIPFKIPFPNEMKNDQVAILMMEAPAPSRSWLGPTLGQGLYICPGHTVCEESGK